MQTRAATWTQTPGTGETGGGGSFPVLDNGKPTKPYSRWVCLGFGHSLHGTLSTPSTSSPRCPSHTLFLALFSCTWQGCVFSLTGPQLLGLSSPIPVSRRPGPSTLESTAREANPLGTRHLVRYFAYPAPSEFAELVALLSSPAAECSCMLSFGLSICHFRSPLLLVVVIQVYIPLCLTLLFDSSSESSFCCATVIHQLASSRLRSSFSLGAYTFDEPRCLWPPSVLSLTPALAEPQPPLLTHLVYGRRKRQPSGTVASTAGPWT